MYKLNKVLLYSTGNYIQCFVINHNGKECEKERVYICISESLCNIPETTAALLNQVCLNLKKRLYTCVYI